MRKICFLDIDGVLNAANPECRKLMEDLKTFWVMCRTNIEHFNSFIEKSGAEIVISSSWRHANDFMAMRELLKDFGFKFPERVIDSTPRRINNEKIIKMATKGIGLKFSMSIPRGWEILEWLEANPTDKFVILDDDHPFSPDREHKALKPLVPKFVQTDSKTGLTEADVEKALKILG